MSDIFDKTCNTLSSFSHDAMQGLQDIMQSGANFIGPVVKGLLDATVGVMPGGGGKSNGKKECKNGKEMSTKANGNGLPHGFTFNRNIIRVAGLSGALAVGLGAYGAHVIMVNNKIPDDQKHSFKTANMYHFIGTFGLVATSLATHPRLSSLLMGVGTLVFCGSCYYHGLTGDPSVKKFAPFGGSTLIVAWLSLLL